MTNVEPREVSKKLRNYHEASDEDIDNLMESDNGHVSSDDSSEQSSNCASSMEDAEGDKKKRKKKSRSQNNPKLSYKCIGYWRENHGHPIFGVSVNHHLADTDPVVFATVGYNRVTIYEVMQDGIKLLQCYADPDTDENFYSCAWSWDSDTGRPVLVRLSIVEPIPYDLCIGVPILRLLTFNQEKALVGAFSVMVKSNIRLTFVSSSSGRAGVS